MLAKGIDVSTNMFSCCICMFQPLLVATPPKRPSFHVSPIIMRAPRLSPIVFRVSYITQNANENIIIFSLTMLKSKLEVFYRLQILQKGR